MNYSRTPINIKIIKNRNFSIRYLKKIGIEQRERTVLEVRTIFGGGEVHLDVVKCFALAQIVVIGGRQEPRTVAPHDRLQVSAVYVKRHRFEPVHLRE